MGETPMSRLTHFGFEEGTYMQRILGVLLGFCVLAPQIFAQNTKDDFTKSLALKADRIIVDSSHPAIFRLTQTTSVSYGTAPMTLHVALAPEAADAKPTK